MRTWTSSTIIAVLLWAGTATAQPLPATSLNTCQSTVRTAAKTYVANYVNAVGTCLQAVAAKVVKDNAPLTSAVASTCVLQFRNISDTRALGRSLGEKLTATIDRKCEPGMLYVTHTLADVLGPGAGVPQPLNAENINSWCANFGGDGSIDSVAEWIDCVRNAHTCAAHAAIATQYPRALEWLALVKPAMQALVPPATDPNKITDAVAGLTALDAAMEGGADDNRPTLQCGGSCGDGLKNGSDQCDGGDLGGATCVSLGFSGGTLACSGSCVLDTSSCVAECGTCGNSVREGFESCDGADLGGASCESLGFVSGTLSCTTGCGFDVSNCHAAAFPATGQVTSYGTGSDGDVRAGRTPSYTDNGDGTITDNNTGVM
ncbi:MAG: hypothetical protein HYR72_08385 [Deltaproteobacteria bacterium]|nr:hypothetical protein [Deltaproteobacteria bacterium]MBI3388770.1 hypothetical protein [Deltaproteobacteria bacterium]